MTNRYFIDLLNRISVGPMNMFEGSPTSRNSQKLAAAGLLVFGIPIVAFSLFEFGKIAALGFPNKVAPVVFLVIGLIGFFVNILAYRLLKGRGVKGGGGVMTPASYYVLGAFCVLLSLVGLYKFYVNLDYKILVGAFCGFVLSSWCFIAARHRGAMREVPDGKIRPNQR